MGENPELGVLTLQEPANAEKTIIVYRSPEMGLQPALLEPYMTRGLKAVAEYAHDVDPTGKVKIHMMATGGAVAEGKLPGQSDEVKGSIYLGIERDDEGSRVKYRPVIRFATRDATYEVFKGSPVNTGKEAEESLKKTLETISELALGKELGSPIEKKAQQELARLTEKFQGGELTVAGGFFSGAKQKEEYRKTFGKKVANTNMEDYQILAGVQTAGKDRFTFGRFQRTHCDPGEIDQGMLDTYGKWHDDPASSLMDEEAYVDAIVFGRSLRWV